MRHISFSLTTRQLLDGTKTVTRRLGWRKLRSGDQLVACEKCMGLKKGEKVRRLALIEVTDVRREPLCSMLAPAYGEREAELEGFPSMLGPDFVAMFCRHMCCHETSPVTRIEFRVLDYFPQLP